jgi:hypothetical protein
MEPARALVYYRHSTLLICLETLSVIILALVSLVRNVPILSTKSLRHTGCIFVLKCFVCQRRAISASAELHCTVYPR